MTTPSAAIDDLAAPLDALLVDAALPTPLPLRRLLPDLSTAKLVGRLAAQPRLAAGQVRDLGVELARIAWGASNLVPAPADRRFADPAWTSNPLLRRLMQAYLAAGGTIESLVTAAGLDWRDEQRVRWVAENLVEALAPSNLPLVNPASLKEAVDTAGMSLLRGGLNLMRDMASPPRIPKMTDGSGFSLGRNLAVTPGSVVWRTEVFELIQYAPVTPAVRKVPLVLVPPTINKFYVLDLAPGRSWIEHLVRSGQQVFVMSWRNPDARHADWGVDTYVQAVVDALDAAARVCGTEKAVLGGACSGGILACLAAARLAGEGQAHRLAGLTLAVTVLDYRRAGRPAAIADRRLAAAATAASRRRGYLDGRALAEVFAWLRPGDLVWHFWVNNYLLGREPPMFDVLFWNADTTRMSAALHAGFVEMAMGEPPDLSTLDVDAYVVGGISDHITPWQSCYRTTQLLGGRSRFVLSTSGHIAAIVNPPGNPKAGYRASDVTPEDPQKWLAETATRQGSWWSDHTAWLAERCGPEKKAPRKLGGAGLRPLVEAPGTYVFDT